MIRIFETHVAKELILVVVIDPVDLRSSKADGTTSSNLDGLHREQGCCAPNSTHGVQAQELAVGLEVFDGTNMEGSR